MEIEWCFFRYLFPFSRGNYSKKNDIEIQSQALPSCVCWLYKPQGSPSYVNFARTPHLVDTIPPIPGWVEKSRLVAIGSDKNTATQVRVKLGCPTPYKNISWVVHSPVGVLKPCIPQKKKVNCDWDHHHQNKNDKHGSRLTLRQSTVATQNPLFFYFRLHGPPCIY